MAAKKAVSLKVVRSHNKILETNSGEPNDAKSKDFHDKKMSPASELNESDSVGYPYAEARIAVGTVIDGLLSHAVGPLVSNG